MPLVNISQAAKLAGITRQHLHSHYIATGKISVDRTLQDKPQIDTAELLRVFGTLQPVDSELTDTTLHNPTPDFTPKNPDITATLQAKIELLQEQLRDARDREKWYQDQLSANTRLLQQELQPPPKKGFWSWF